MKIGLWIDHDPVDADAIAAVAGCAVATLGSAECAEDFDAVERVVERPIVDQIAIDIEGEVEAIPFVLDSGVRPDIASHIADDR